MYDWFEEADKEEKEKETVKCPVCEEEFRDLRGLTSHARNVHELSREDTYGLLKSENEEKDTLGKFLVGAGAILLGVLGLGILKR